MTLGLVPISKPSSTTKWICFDPPSVKVGFLHWILVPNHVSTTSFGAWSKIVKTCNSMFKNVHQNPPIFANYIWTTSMWWLLKFTCVEIGISIQ